MKLAYADPPYLGLCSKYGHFHGDGGCWDDIETHDELIQKLGDEYDGWALSLHTPSLREILPLCPPTARVGAWLKTGQKAWPGVRIGYTWEPVIFNGGRTKPADGIPYTADAIREAPATGRNFFGAKADPFLRWVLTLLGYHPDYDTLTDLFTGSGTMPLVVAQLPLPLELTP